jgi:ATP-binding cassette subfamily F protein uup
MLKDFSYEFCRGDKIGIVGFNGVGKSTFIRVISGAQPIDSGEIERGEMVVMGVYDQMGIQLKPDDQTVLEFVLESVRSHDGAAVSAAPDEARELLKQFEFPRQRWNTRLVCVSADLQVLERRRLYDCDSFVLVNLPAGFPCFLVVKCDGCSCSLC